MFSNLPTEDAVNAIQKEYALQKQALEMWRDSIVKRGGTLNQVSPLTKEAREGIMEMLNEPGGINDQLRAIKHTAIYGTRDPERLKGVLHPPVALSRQEQGVDDYFHSTLEGFSGGPDGHDFESWKKYYGEESDAWQQRVADERELAPGRETIYDCLLYTSPSPRD